MEDYVPLIIDKKILSLLIDSVNAYLNTLDTLKDELSDNEEDVYSDTIHDLELIRGMLNGL